jgi:hypothetical protein
LQRYFQLVPAADRSLPQIINGLSPMVKADTAGAGGRNEGQGALASCGIEGLRQRKLDSIFRVTQYAGQETEHRVTHKSAFHF